MSGVFWEAQQSVGIAKAGSEASQAKSQAQQVEREMLYLSRRVERLSIACQALWELLREKTEMADDDIRSKMLEIDLRDGELDGKMTRHPLKCAACGQMGNSSRTTCLYCGADMPRDHLFE